MFSTRRSFLTQSATTLIASRLCAQAVPAPTTHPDLAALDHDRILAAADLALTLPVTPITSLPIPHSPGTPHDFFTTAPDPAKPELEPANPHADALLQLSLAVPALAAATLLTATSDPARAEKYRAHAAAHLRAWFIDPATSMTPSLPHAQLSPITSATNPNTRGTLETTGLAELALSIPFLHLAPDDLKPLQTWFAAFTDWLTTSTLGRLARDNKDHTASSWLLQVASYARLTANDHLLADLRNLFRHSTLRAQILADGTFPHELTTPNPFRNSLFNLDLLAGAAELLSTRFESVWDFELQDGPGLRSAVARHVPWIADRNSWPYPADRTLFKQLPCRRPALLFAARAFQRPDYASLWRNLTPAQPTHPTLLRTFPIRQPLLWTTHPTPNLSPTS